MCDVLIEFTATTIDEQINIGSLVALEFTTVVGVFNIGVLKGVLYSNIGVLNTILFSVTSLKLFDDDRSLFYFYRTRLRYLPSQ